MCNNRLPPPSQGRNGLSVSCHPVVLRLIIALRHTPQPSCLSLFYALPFEDAFPRFSLLKSLFFLNPAFSPMFLAHKASLFVSDHLTGKSRNTMTLNMIPFVGKIYIQSHLSILHLLVLSMSFCFKSSLCDVGDHRRKSTSAFL